MVYHIGMIYLKGREGQAGERTLPGLICLLRFIPALYSFVLRKGSAMSFLKVFCPFCRTQIRRIEVSDSALSRKVQVTCFKCGKRFSYVPGMGNIAYNKRMKYCSRSGTFCDGRIPGIFTGLCTDRTLLKAVRRLF